MLVSRLVARIPTHFVRAASFPPKKAANKKPLDAAVDPVVFLQLRQRIIERHAPPSVELDESQLNLINKNIFNIRRGLDKRDLDLVRKSWIELQQANHLHILTQNVVEQIGQLAVASLPSSKSLTSKWNPDRKRFVEEVALTAAAAHSTDVLNACFIAYLKGGDSKSVFELYHKFRRLPGTQVTEEESDLMHTEDDITSVASKTRPGRVKALLAILTAHAMEDNFQGALKEYLDSEITFRRYSADEFLHDFLRNMAHDPTLQNTMSTFYHRLELAKSVARPQSTSHHIHNLSAQTNSPLLEEFYNSILDGMTGPDAFIAADATSITSGKLVAMSDLIWGSFLAAFLRRDRSDLAAKLWKDMSRFGILPGILTWNKVVNVYLDRGATREVLGAWSTMQAHGVQPDANTYCALLTSFLAENRVDEALQWLRKFETDVKPSCSDEESLKVYNATIHGLLRIGAETAPTAFSLFQKMKDKGPKPNLVSYNTILRYHGRAGNLKSMAACINDMSVAGVTGDVITFSTILSALLKVGRTDAPQMVVGMMRKQGVKANMVTYSAIIDSQLRDGHLQAALSLLDEMEKETDPDVVPNEITYTSILAGLYRVRLLTADQVEMYKQDILGRMKKRRIKLKTSGYNILLKATLSCEEPRGLDDGLKFYQEMVRQKIKPVNNTWYILLAGLAGRGEWQIAREIADEMFSSGAVPSNSVLRLVSKIRKNGN
ncbi:hypothetical protein C8R43DRAFT_1030033 [Mycena crocata]|nr:hypothetical protein C8R43DRAFT_1030033 [Mycena crocata]